MALWSTPPQNAENLPRILPESMPRASAIRTALPLSFIRHNRPRYACTSPIPPRAKTGAAVLPPWGLRLNSARPPAWGWHGAVSNSGHSCTPQVLYCTLVQSPPLGLAHCAGPARAGPGRPDDYHARPLFPLLFLGPLFIFVLGLFWRLSVAIMELKVIPKSSKNQA